jgi:hypothetical protein
MKETGTCVLRKQMRILMIALLIASSILFVHAQEKTISSSEFAAAERSANAPFFSKQTLAKWSITTESRTDGRPQTDYRLRAVMEFGPDNSFRRSSESSFGTEPVKFEYEVKVGGRKFIRTGDGEWKEATSESYVEPDATPELEPKVTEQNVEYKYLGSGVLNGRKVRMYLKAERRKTIANGGAVSESEVSTRYWFGEDVDLYRSEYSSTTITGDKTFHTNITIEKQLDATISIIAPALSN